MKGVLHEVVTEHVKWVENSCFGKDEVNLLDVMQGGAGQYEWSGTCALQVGADVLAKRTFEEDRLDVPRF